MTRRETYDIIGDVHGCYEALRRLCDVLGYDNDFRHPDGRRLVFVGDLINRGPDTVRVLRLAIRLFKRGDALLALGNHDDVLNRYLLGESLLSPKEDMVKIVAKGDLEKTIDEIEGQLDAEEFKRDIMELFQHAPLCLTLDNGKLIVVHAGIEEHMIGHTDDPEIRRFVLNGDAIGKSPEGKTLRRDWAADYRGPAFIVYGHTPEPKAEIRFNTVNIDTGAVRGNLLTALRWPEKTIVSVPSQYNIPQF